MRRHLSNAVFGVIDYASYPFGMLLVAPIVLHRLGASEYGLWMIATAVISTGSIVAGGFSDANIQRVASLRGSGSRESMAHAVRSILGINLVLGLVVVAVVWTLAPYGARHIATSHDASVSECFVALRVATLVILARSVESAGVSTQRAFEQYRGTVLISASMRLLTLASAAALALAGHKTVSILVATAIFFAAGACLQLLLARRFLGPVPLWPSFHPEEARLLLRLGVFAWLDAMGGLIFAQFDRILLGVSLGAVVVAPYALCVQFTQPLYALTASALSFLFPYLSQCSGNISRRALNRILLKACACNLAIVACGVTILIFAGNRLIRLWGGPIVAHTAASILSPIILSSALAGLSVTGTYAMQALGLFRTVAGLSVVGRAAMLLVMIVLLHRTGLQGLATARVCYGFVALLIYVPLIRSLVTQRHGDHSARIVAIPYELQEGSEL